MSKGTGGRHEGRPGYRIGILGPTEAGKTTLAMRIILDWMEKNPKLPVYSNIKLFTPKPFDNPDYHKIPLERTVIYRTPLQWKRIHGGLLFCDEISEYINSIPDITSGKMLKILIHLAKNLMKQDNEWIYTDQHALSLHKRVRINVNTVYYPSFDPNFDTVSYQMFDSIDEYLDFKENPFTKHIPKAFKFHASEFYPYFDTKEIVTPKEVRFIPEREAAKVEKWFVRKEKHLDLENGLNDALSYYQEKQLIDWTSKQERAVRYILKEKLDGEKEE